MPLKAVFRIDWLLRLTKGIVLAGGNRRLDAESDALDADRDVERLGVAEVGVVARRAGDILPARQDRIPEQQPSRARLSPHRSDCRPAP